MNLKVDQNNKKRHYFFIIASLMGLLSILLMTGGCGKSTSSASHLGATGDFVAFIAAPTNNAVIRFPLKEVCQNGQVIVETDSSANPSATLKAHISGGTSPYSETWNVYGTYDATIFTAATSTESDKVLFVGEEGIYTINLTVIDGIGRTANDSIQVRVSGYVTTTVDPVACAESGDTAN